MQRLTAVGSGLGVMRQGARDSIGCDRTVVPDSRSAAQAAKVIFASAIIYDPSPRRRAGQQLKPYLPGTRLQVIRRFEDGRGLVLVVVVKRLAPLLYSASHLTNCKNRKQGQSPLLIGGKRLIKRLPRIGELLKVGCSLSQDVSASLHEIYGITVT